MAHRAAAPLVPAADSKQLFLISRLLKSCRIMTASLNAETRDSRPVQLPTARTARKSNNLGGNRTHALLSVMQPILTKVGRRRRG
jgi:hypothetical protein